MAEFFDVEGIPVSLGNVSGSPFGSTAWDTDPPRVFDPDSARRNGAPISEAVFKALVEAVRAPRLRGLTHADWSKAVAEEMAANLNRKVTQEQEAIPLRRT